MLDDQEECSNLRKGPPSRRHAYQRPWSVYDFFIIIIQHTHQTTYQVHVLHLLLRIFPLHRLHLPIPETPPSLNTATASPPAFVSCMSIFPLVGSAFCVYEQEKASSCVVTVRSLILIHRRNAT